MNICAVVRSVEGHTTARILGEKAFTDGMCLSGLVGPLVG